MHRFTFALLPALLCAAPAFAHVESTHFSGALGAQGVQKAAAYLQADGPSESPVEQMTREQLQGEYRRLDSERPGLGIGIGLTAAGGGCLVIGGVYGLYAFWLSYLFNGVDSTVVSIGIGATVFCVALVVAGAIMLPIGIYKLVKSLRARRAYGERMDDINARLEQMDRGGYPQQPGYPPEGQPGEANPPPPPLPPPPPPPGAMFRNVQPSVVLASF
jgi:hypothetical protein